LIIDSAPQGTTAWLEARLGVPSASQFSRIITPATLKPSASAGPYALQLATEWALGMPEDDTQSQWMDRGNEQEDEARSWYGFTRDVEVRQVGFCRRDDGLVGASPDGLVGDDGGIEIKVLAAKNHLAMLLDPARFEVAHRMQVQGGLLVTGRSWWDLIAYNCDLPKLVVRVERDPEIIDALEVGLQSLLARLADVKDRLLTLGVKPAQIKTQRVSGRACTYPGDDGRWCMAAGEIETAEGWRCEKHKETV